METTKKYKSPPIIEAICEFSFPEGKISFDKIESDFGKKIEHAFPSKNERKNLNFIFQGKDNKLTHEVQEQRGLIQFVSSNKNNMVQIGNNLLAVNHMKPYVSWEAFQPTIIENLMLYCEIAQQKTINQASFRYINQIEIPAEGVQLGDYFNYTITLPKGISENLANIFCKTEHLYDGKHVLSITLHSLAFGKKDFTTFIFDISYNHIGNILVNEKNILEVLKDSHLRLNSVFEQSLTDKCKLIFDN